MRRFRSVLLFPRVENWLACYAPLHGARNELSMLGSLWLSRDTADRLYVASARETRLPARHRTCRSVRYRRWGLFSGVLLPSPRTVLVWLAASVLDNNGIDIATSVEVRAGVKLVRVELAVAHQLVQVCGLDVLLAVPAQNECSLSGGQQVIW
jgi:hypothetical protein